MLTAYDDLPRRKWWRIVSPLRRRPRGVRSDRLTVWTFQSRDAYNVLVDDGVLRGDPRYADLGLSHAYPWMQRQADQRLPTNGSGLVWLWPAPTWRSLIGQARHAPDDVLLELLMPRPHILISDFAEWHIPLNNGLYAADTSGGRDVDEMDRILQSWDERLRAAGVGPTSARVEWRAALREETESSWEAILDPATWSRGSRLQAVAHAIHADEVVAATRVR